MMKMDYPPDYPPEKIISILKNSRLLNQFDEEQLTKLLAFSSVERFEKGTLIIEEKQKNKNIYVLLEGRLEVYVGDELILKLRRKGDIIGEMSVITQSLTSASIVASSSVVLFIIPSQEICNTGQKDLQSQWFKLFSDILVEKLSMTNEKVVGFHETSVSLDHKKRELVHKTMILQSIMGSMTDGVVVSDGAGRILQINNAFVQMIGGVSIPERIDEWPEAIGIYQQDRKTHFQVDDLPMVKVGAGILIESEEIYINNDHLDAGVWLQATGSPLKADDGQLLDGCVVVFRNFTKKKLEEIALIKAKENAEATAKSKSDFLSVMSHELRTPLNGILGLTNLLRKSSLASDQAQWLDDIEKSGRSLLGKIKNILHFNALESGDVQIHTEKLTLMEIVRHVVQYHDRTAGKKGITIDLSLCKETEQSFSGDREKIITVLDHLLDNAVKYTSKGTIGVHAVVVDKNETSVKFLIKVTDDGIGFPDENVQALFHPFFQADASLSRRFEGTGLGLTIAKKVVEVMGGNLSVESKPDQGSCFMFTLILVKLNDPRVKSTVAQVNDIQSLINKDYAKRNPLSILVAEDNKVNQLLIKKILKKLGYQVQIAENGREALEACKQNVFDLVLMDIQMPEMDGITAAKMILDDPSMERFPHIVALTANIAEGIKESCLSVGMRDYMTKPLSVKILVDVLERLPK
jgi:signal transduction histidine kinase